LLNDPSQIFQICSETKKVLPSNFLLTAKIRLGDKDFAKTIAVAKAIEDAGVRWLTVHARLKIEDYDSPVHWEWITKIREAVKIKVIANGGIWTAKDAQKCRTQTGCEDIMLAQGVLAQMNLAQQIKTGAQAYTWEQTAKQLKKYISLAAHRKSEIYALNHAKQWIVLLTRAYPEAQSIFTNIKRTNQLSDILEIL
jgi:tRNA-dihydrouridine synthase C